MPTALSLHARTTCRVCPEDIPLTTVIDLGEICVSAFPRSPSIDPLRAPLRLGRCPTCTLVQLFETVSPEVLYGRQYWYKSGVNEVMVEELKSVVLMAMARLPLGLDPGDRVLDIGANDGTLLSFYPDIAPRVAVEPSPMFADALRLRASEVHERFFPPATLDRFGEPYRIITSIASFYNVNDPNAYVHAIKELLAPHGIWIIQLQDLLGMLEQTAFDNICHEHVEYYTLYSLQQLLRINQLTIWDVEPRAINGGSLRLYVGHGEHEPAWARTHHILDQLAREDSADLMNDRLIPQIFLRFMDQIGHHRSMFRALLQHAKARGPIDGYGASTKGNTLFQVFDIDHTDIRQIAERSPEKVGRVTVKSNIPIVSEETWREDPAPLTIVPIWQFRKAVIQREAEYLKSGGAFAFPLPSMEIVTSKSSR